MKKAVIGSGLLISGTILCSTQRIIDTIFTANNWQIASGGFNLLQIIGIAAVIGGAALCVMALKEK